MSKQLKLSFAGKSTAGGRAQNQDAFAVHHSQDNQVLTNKGVVACLADGVSCSQNGQQASQLCVTQFIQDYLSTADTLSVKQAANQVLSALNAWLHHHSQLSELRHNGFVSTFSGLIFKSNSLHVFHVGDTRIYRLRQGELRQLTRDHCHQGFGDKGMLTRALGMDSHLEIDYQCHEVQLGDLYLLTTDGVHDWLSLADLQAVLQQPISLAQSAVQAALNAQAELLVTQALAKGSEDNLSSLLLKVEALPYGDMHSLSTDLLQRVIPPVMTVGNRLDNLEVISILHSGSRSHVYLVEQYCDGGTTNKQRYVLKAPSLHFSDDNEYLNGFIRELWVGQRVLHPSLMKVHPTQSAFLYHLCEFIEGQNLRQWMYDNPEPSLAQVRSLLAEIIIGVRALQRLGILHRDLKPENIMISPQGKVVLIDYGAAQAQGLIELTGFLTSSDEGGGQGDESPLGALDYIAPEYLLTGVATHEADIFSMGVIVYEMLTAQLPYQHNTLIFQRRTSNWHYISALQYRPQLPLWVDLALKKACHPQKNQRYSSMSEFLADISQPNKAILTRLAQSPLIERDPVKFWKTMCGLLLFILMFQLLEPWSMV
jgi:serine/threonine protein phosphatase PrpC/predicted Ser/Thr protein kinase